MDATDRPWRCLRRHRHRTLSGDPRDADAVSGGSRSSRHRAHVGRRLRSELPVSVDGFELVSAAPTEYVWRNGSCTVTVRLARNVWHTTFATAAGAPQIEEHGTRGRALAYAVGFMEQFAGVTVPGHDENDVGGVLDEVELAIGQMRSAIDSMPDIAAMSDVLLENV